MRLAQWVKSLNFGGPVWEETPSWHPQLLLGLVYL